MKYEIDEFNSINDKPVIYILFHCPTRHFYVGSTNIPSRVVKTDYLKLTKHKPFNLEMDSVVCDVSEVYHTYYSFDSIEEARRIKYGLISYYADSGKCFNVKSKKVVLSAEETATIVDIVNDISNGGKRRFKPRPIPIGKRQIFPKLNRIPKPAVSGIEDAEYIPLQLDHQVKTIGTYIIYFPNTGRFYVGSAKNLYGRIVSHLSQLRTGKHTNIPLQEEYKKNPGVEVLAFPTETRTDAYSLEQKVIDNNDETTGLLNRAVLVTSNRGIEFTPDVKNRLKNIRAISGAGKPQKKIIVGDKQYQSIAAASRDLSIDRSVIRRRLNNPEEKHYNFI